MGMGIDLERLKSNLQPASNSSYYTPGLFRAIEAAHYECRSDQVDWGSFTLAEAEQALGEAMVYASDEELSAIRYLDEDELTEEDRFPNRENAIHQFLHNLEAISKIKRARPGQLMDCFFRSH